jgi:hypothetical protein
MKSETEEGEMTGDDKLVQQFFTKMRKFIYKTRIHVSRGAKYLPGDDESDPRARPVALRFQAFFLLSSRQKIILVT